jgi:integrase
MKHHILPTFSGHSLGDIRPTDVQSWVQRKSAELSPGTVGVIYRYLASIFRSAVEDGLIPKSPCRNIKLPKRERRQVVPPKTAQVQELIQIVPDRYRALVVLAASTGLRQGEAFGLTVEHIDFLRKRIEIVQQLVLIRGRGPTLGPPKTDAGYRTVPLPDVALHALAAHIQAYPPGPDGLVFTDEASQPLRRNRFGEVWRAARKKVHGLDSLGFHGLRHYYASLLIRHGESVKVVQSRLGHANASETLDTYSHLWPDSEDQTRAAVDSVLGADGVFPQDAHAVGQ